MFFFLTSSQIILGFLSTDDLSLFLKDENTLGTPAIRFATRLSLFWVRFPRKRIHVTFLRNNNREVKRVFRKRGFSLCVVDMILRIYMWPGKTSKLRGLFVAGICYNKSARNLVIWNVVAMLSRPWGWAIKQLHEYWL